MEQGKINWTGASGTKYLFTIYPKDTSFNEVDGNYIFARFSGNSWQAVYIGEGNLAIRTKDPGHQQCAQKKGFTHYHVHVNENETARRAEESDLILGNPECLEENGGCNQTKTGK